MKVIYTAIFILVCLGITPAANAACSSFAGKWTGKCTATMLDGTTQTITQNLSVSQAACTKLVIGGNNVVVGDLMTTARDGTTPGAVPNATWKTITTYFANWMDTPQTVLAFDRTTHSITTANATRIVELGRGTLALSGTRLRLQVQWDYRRYVSGILKSYGQQAQVCDFEVAP